MSRAIATSLFLGRFLIGLFASRLRDGFVAVLFFAFIATLMRSFPTIPDFIVGGFLSSVLIGSVTMPMGYGAKKFFKSLLPSANSFLPDFGDHIEAPWRMVLARNTAPERSDDLQRPLILQHGHRNFEI
jgi:hypothetical protein